MKILWVQHSTGDRFLACSCSEPFFTTVSKNYRIGNKKCLQNEFQIIQNGGEIGRQLLIYYCSISTLLSCQGINIRKAFRQDGEGETVCHEKLIWGKRYVYPFKYISKYRKVLFE